MPYLCIAFVLGAATGARAHPLGNDSITHFNVLYVLPDRLEVDFLLDIAENPTQFIETNEMDANRDGRLGRDEQEAWLESKVDEYAAFLTASVDGLPLNLSLVPEQVDETGRKTTTSKVIVPMLGPMGMTYRIVIRYTAGYPDALGPGEHVIRYEDKTYPQHMGLKLVLLEPPSVLCRLYDVPDSALRAGPVPGAIASALADEALSLESPGDARLEAIPAGPDGRPCWDLIDGGRRLRLTVGEEAIDVRVLPHCEFIDPRVPLVSEDNAAFRYEQYDPLNLPDVRKADVRFVVVGDAAPAGRPASQPVRVVASRPAGDSEPGLARDAAAASEASQAPTALPAHVADFLDPNYNPVQSSNYQRQAEKMIGLLRSEWSPVLFFIVTGLAFVWGALHALMPGHAKTVVAAYLISQRGTYRHAALLAIIVTVTHTALVVIMGLVIWYYQKSNPRLAPTLQLWLGLIAGVLVAAMGLTLLWRAGSGRLGAHDHDHEHHHHGEQDTRSWWRKLFTHSHPHVPAPEHVHAHGHPHTHDHSHAHDHEHADPHHHHHHEQEHPHSHEHGHVHGHAHTHGHPHAHDHAHDHGQPHAHSHAASPRRAGDSDQLTLRMLLVLGVTGGIVPCPSATIIMFLGIGANVIGGALYAVAVFSLGLALTLMAIGSLALASRRYAAKVLADAQHEHELSGPGRAILLRIVPALSGLAVITLGGMIAAHYIFLMRGLESPFPWMG